GRPDPPRRVLGQGSRDILPDANRQGPELAIIAGKACGQRSRKTSRSSRCACLSRSFLFGPAFAVAGAVEVAGVAAFVIGEWGFGRGRAALERELFVLAFLRTMTTGLSLEVSLLLFTSSPS